MSRLFNVMLNCLAGKTAYNWFAPSTPADIIVEALDTVLAGLGERPWGVDQRGMITYSHALLGTVWEGPFSSRSTYAHCVEFGRKGPVRIESMFPLGESGAIYLGGSGPVFDSNFFSMTPNFDPFVPRSFPLFD